MLFLQNLASIEWQTETDDGVYLSDVKGSRRELFGESRENGQIRRSSAHYLLFTRNVNLGDNDRELDIRIAFRLDEKGMIVSDEDQRLVVYFPTEQVTGLKFRLHGPFLLTDNRAHIKIGNDTNNRLIHECAVLLCESIQHIKEAGLLTVDFLSLLPIRKENVPSLFQPLYDQVLQTLKQYPLLPTTDGTFACATQAKLARSTELRELLNGPQLSSLYGTSSSLHWLSSDVTLDRTPDLFRYLNKDLEVDIVDPEAFARKLEKAFLEKQTDEWLVQFYIFLSKLPSLNNIIKWKPILRLENNSHVSPFEWTYPYNNNGMPNAYLLREGNSKFPLVKRSLLTDDTVYTFLKAIGLSEPDIVDEVLKFILPAYQTGKISLNAKKRNMQDLDKIQEALHRTSHAALQELISALNATPFILANNSKTSERVWKTPGEVYCESEELLTWFDGNEQAWFITDSFPESLASDLSIPTHLEPRAKPATGTTNYVMIHDWRGYHQRGLHGFDPHASLDGLQYALDQITLDRARMLWDFLLEHRHLIKGVVETSRYQNFSDAQSEESFSEIGQLCCQEAWLPTENGDFLISPKICS
jgi:hypothetical protein